MTLKYDVCGRKLFSLYLTVGKTKLACFFLPFFLLVYYLNARLVLTHVEHPKVPKYKRLTLRPKCSELFFTPLIFFVS
jgi:hypothetical protein